jgi:hypothetical protein
MNTLIANQIREKILTKITWADRVVGMVKTMNTTGGDETAVNRSFPVSCDINVDQRECLAKSKQYAVVPDSALKALIYFEDGGASPVGRSPRGTIFESSMTLVCWMNLQNLGQTSCTASAFAQVQLIDVLNNINISDPALPINNLKITEISVNVKDARIFSKYTYNEKQVQYLHYPYDYFSIGLKVTFEVPFGCIDNSWVETPIACLSTNV